MSIKIITSVFLLASAFQFCLANHIGGQYQCPYAKLVQNVIGVSSSGAASVVLDSISPSGSNRISKSDGHDGLDHLIWDKLYQNQQNDSLKCGSAPHRCASSYSYRSFDGSCNNLNYPGNGMAWSRFSRLLRPKYGDLISSPSLSSQGTPLPNARRLSLSVYGEETTSDNLRTMGLMQLGQFIAHDITQQSEENTPADCCKQVDNKLCYPIEIPFYDPIYKGTGRKCLQFARSNSDNEAICPRQGYGHSEKLSTVTAYLDLSSIYGNSKEQSEKTRLYNSGLLKTTFLNNRHLLPISHNSNGECGEGNLKCFSIPDLRNQFTPTVAAFHTLFQREHNRLALQLRNYNPQYSDERIFQEARKINIAQYQKIVFYEWLPALIGANNAYQHQLIYNSNGHIDDYDPSVNAAPYAEFSAAAFRYAHHTIPGTFSLVSPLRDYNKTLRLSDYFDKPETIDLLAYPGNFDAVLRGIATQPQKLSDNSIDREIKHYFDRKMHEEFGSDLKSIDIQRARDFGLASYNDLRELCGLPRATFWSEFSDFISPNHINILKGFYASPDDVELSIGGSLEKHVPNSLFGPTFQCIVTKQFLKTRRGDRFFFENSSPLVGLSPDQLAEIRKVSLSGLFCINSDNLQYLQKNIFLLPNYLNPNQHCTAFPQLDLSKWAIY